MSSDYQKNTIIDEKELHKIKINVYKKRDHRPRSQDTSRNKIERDIDLDDIVLPRRKSKALFNINLTLFFHSFYDTHNYIKYYIYCYNILFNIHIIMSYYIIKKYTYNEKNNKKITRYNKCMCIQSAN